MSKLQSETLQYRFLSLPTRSRFILFTTLMVFGLFLQFIAYFPGHSAAGLIVLALGSLLMIGSTYTKVPQDLGYEDWKPVNNDKFIRVLENYAIVKKAKIPIYLKKKDGKTLFIVLIVLSIGLGGVLSTGSSNIIFLLIALDLLVFLFPLFLSGHVTVHAPKELKQKMDRFHAVMQLADELKQTGVTITPIFRFDKDSKGNHIPEDVRLMVDIKRKPDDFIGVQLQITINNGPNGPVPYMYAVVIFKKTGDSFRQMESFSWTARGASLLTEKGDEEDFTFLIVRQRTDDGGYHTTNEQCRALVRRIAENVSRITQQ